MNAVIETICTRRSVRAYLGRRVEPELLKTVVDCGLHAPSGHNSQSVRLFVITRPEMIAALNCAVQRELAAMEPLPGSVIGPAVLRARKDGYHFIHGAPVLICAAAPREGENSLAECAAAVENMLLAAHALGLGACWSNQLHWLSETSAVRALLALLGLSGDEAIFAALGLGYPASLAASVLPRRVGRVVSDAVLP